MFHMFSHHPTLDSWWLIAIALLVVFLVLFVVSACRVGAAFDRHMDSEEVSAAPEVEQITPV